MADLAPRSPAQGGARTSWQPGSRAVSDMLALVVADMFTANEAVCSLVPLLKRSYPAAGAEQHQRHSLSALPPPVRRLARPLRRPDHVARGRRAQAGSADL